MKRRVKTAPRVPAFPACGKLVGFIDVAQPGMLVLKSTAFFDAKGALAGCYVKVAPTIRSSERASLDTKTLREQLLDMGATAVVVVPTVIPDAVESKQQRQEAPVASAESHLRAWFGGAKLAAPKVIEAALAEALDTVSEVGL